MSRPFRNVQYLNLALLKSESSCVPRKEYFPALQRTERGHAIARCRFRMYMHAAATPNAVQLQGVQPLSKS
jgi:hypothetical protein